MKRILFAVLAVTATALLVTGCGGSDDSANVPQNLLKGCGGHLQKVSGRSIIKVGSGQCVDADNGATVVAAGNAVVGAHGDTVVRASDNVTLVVFNDKVRCSIDGDGVTIINAVKTDGFSLHFLDPSCNMDTYLP